MDNFTDVGIRTNQESIDRKGVVPEWFFEEGAVLLPEQIESGLRLQEGSLQRLFLRGSRSFNGSRILVTNSGLTLEREGATGLGIPRRKRVEKRMTIFNSQSRIAWC